MTVSFGSSAGLSSHVAVLGGLAGSAVLVGFVFLAATASVMSSSGLAAGSNSQSPLGLAVSPLAESEIPPDYLRLYQAAGRRYGLDWAILAGIGRLECDHGRDADPSCTVEGAVNSAGAGGPMQFIASTWAVYGVDATGDGHPDRWNAGDAIYSAANYLRSSGAPANYSRAIYAYNHSSWYVAEVLAWAERYTAKAPVVGSSAEAETGEGSSLPGSFASSTPVRFIEGTVARLDSDDGHIALLPSGVPEVVQAMLVAGNELQELPYGPSGHPDPRNALEEDCSSTVNYVLYRSGVRSIGEILRENPLAQDYVHWGDPGPGRWVTIYATDSPTPHVFIVIAGLRLDTSFAGTDTGPNSSQSGPRWRILDHIPTWAHWAVHHPPGL